MEKQYPNMDDQELDNLFRRKAEDPEIPYEADDWKKMRDKLAVNGAKSSRTNNSSNSLYGIGLLLLLSGAMYVLITQDLFVEPTVSESEHISALGSFEEFSVKESGDILPEKESGSVEKVGSEVNLGRNLSSSDGAIQAIGNQSNTSEEVNLKLLPGVEEIHESKSDGSRAQDINLGEVERPDIVNVDFGIAERFSFTPKKQRNLESAIFVELQSNDVIPIKAMKSNFTSASRFAVAILLSPDASALKINEIQGLGTNAGLNLEYFIHPNWSLNMGVWYAFKTYQSNSAYQGSYGKTASGFSGDCYILDIPLNLKFYAINGESARWYASAGLSSYLMLREKYELTYKSAYGEIQKEMLDIKNQNQHYFKIINLSVGYERQLSKNLALQVEPYLKIPISGVGEGSVKLKSAGALIGLKYRW